MLRVVTEAGDEIRATADHPFWTPDGMVPLGELQPGDHLAMNPFQGVPYTAPSDDIIVSEADIAAKWKELQKGTQGNGLTQVLDFLHARGLLPLRSSSPAVPFLCKILGFVFGDGTLHFAGGTGKGVVHFYGHRVNLEPIRCDLQAIGFTPSRVYSRQRQHVIETAYERYEFEHQEEWFKVVGSGLALLLVCLGAPLGNKAKRDYAAPDWLSTAPLWHKRLFLAALFGAELTTPATVTDHGTVFAAPTLSLNKRPANVSSGRKFLGQIADWLRLFGVTPQTIDSRQEQVNSDGQPSIRLRLIISPTTANLIRLWSRIDYEYNGKRTGLAALAVQYLKHKQHLIALRDETAFRSCRIGPTRSSAARDHAAAGGDSRQSTIHRAFAV